jgi:hypothetical protein
MKTRDEIIEILMSLQTELASEVVALDPNATDFYEKGLIIKGKVEMMTDVMNALK